MTTEAWLEVGQLGTDTLNPESNDVVALLRSVGTKAELARVDLKATNLSARTRNTLHRAGMSTLGDLAQFQDDFDLQRTVRGLGAGSLSELRDLIHRWARGEAVQQGAESEAGVIVVPEAIADHLREHGVDPSRIGIESLELSPRVERGLARAGLRVQRQAKVPTRRQ